MFKIKYSRESAGNGDDIYPRNKSILLFNNATIEKIVHKIISTPNYLAKFWPDSHWVLRSSNGDIADLTLIPDGTNKDWTIKYLKYPKDYLVKDLKIDSVYADKVEE